MSGGLREMSDPEWRAFVGHGTRTGKLATVRADGRPHVVPVSFVVQGSEVLFFTGPDTVKGRALRHEPRFALCVDDERPPFAFVLLEGEAQVDRTSEQVRTWAARIATRYLGAEHADAIARRTEELGEVLVRGRITKVVARTGSPPGTSPGSPPDTATGTPPGSPPGAATGTRPGPQPDAATGTRPGPQPDTATDARPGSQPGAPAVAPPGALSGTATGAGSGSPPGALSGTAAGTSPGAAHGSTPGVLPGTSLGAATGVRPGGPIGSSAGAVESGFDVPDEPGRTSHAAGRGGGLEGLRQQGVVEDRTDAGRDRSVSAADQPV
ncbi:TIGR03618 family F420-dependent PPOX class oxidoreductase [Actinosynnema sp. NPDC059335]|uniref:TIGR03618 family F420-dependent PPOX class oxidoreductase n=1 Tax=Actinosynnema sp. NPDC059335 TaxID=3346804 RepID=UPI0036701DFC